MTTRLIPLLAALTLIPALAAAQEVIYQKAATSLVLTHNPYLQLGKSPDGQTMEVVWQTDPGLTKDTVQWRQTGGDWIDAQNLPNYTINVPGTNQVLQHALIRPDFGKYFDYRLQREGKTIFSATAHGRPAEDGMQTFVVLGDCGDNVPAEAHISYEANQLRPNYVVITGDLVYENGADSQYATNFFPYFTALSPNHEKGSPLMSSSLTVGVTGNHDLEDNDTDKFKDAWGYFQYWIQPLNGPVLTKDAPTLVGKNAAPILAAAGDRAPRMANFSFDMGSVHWLVLDSRAALNANDPEFKNWIDQDLKASTKKWKFVTFHEPPFHTSDKHQNDKQMRPLQQLFEADGVDMVWCGHVHNYQVTQPIQTGPKKDASPEDLNKDDWSFDANWNGDTVTQKNGIIYVIEGAGGKTLYEAAKEGHKESWKPWIHNYLGQYSFAFVTIDEDTVRVTQRNENGALLDDWKVTK